MGPAGNKPLIEVSSQPTGSTSPVWMKMMADTKLSKLREPGMAWPILQTQRPKVTIYDSLNVKLSK